MNTSHHRPSTTRRSFGFTLLEAVLSLTLLSILMVSVGSAVLFASQATPGEDSVVATTLRDSEALARIAEDLTLARYVLEASQYAVTVVVADRTGDGVPDRLRYSWSGSQGDPLKYSVNGGNAATLIESVTSFSLGYTLQSETQIIPGPIVYGAETKLSSHENYLFMYQYNTTATAWYGQTMTPGLPSGAIGFMPTRVELYGQKTSTDDGVLALSLHAVDNGDPGDVVYGAGTLSESRFGNSDQWCSTDMAADAIVPAGQKIALVCGYGGGSGTTARLRGNFLLSGGLLSSGNAGGSWSIASTSGLLHRLYGRIAYASDDYEVTRKHYTAIKLSLISQASGRSAITRRVRLLHAPTQLDQFWEADFEAVPTSLDLNADGAADWSYSGSMFPENSLDNGVWTSSNNLSAQPVGKFVGVVMVQARMRSTSGQGPAIYGPFTVNSGGELLPIVTQLRQDGTGGQELVIYNEVSPGTPYARITGLNQGWVDICLTLIPAHSVVMLEINGEVAGSLLLTGTAVGTTPRTLWLGPLGNDAGFADVRVMVGGSCQVSDEESGGGLIGGLLDLLF